MRREHNVFTPHIAQTVAKLRVKVTVTGLSGLLAGVESGLQPVAFSCSHAAGKRWASKTFGLFGRRWASLGLEGLQPSRQA